MNIGVLDIIRKSQTAKFITKIFEGVRKDLALQLNRILQNELRKKSVRYLRRENPNYQTVSGKRHYGEEYVQHC